MGVASASVVVSSFYCIDFLFIQELQVSLAKVVLKEAHDLFAGFFPTFDSVFVEVNNMDGLHGLVEDLLSTVQILGICC